MKPTSTIAIFVSVALGVSSLSYVTFIPDIGQEDHSTARQMPRRHAPTTSSAIVAGAVPKRKSISEPNANQITSSRRTPSDTVREFVERWDGEVGLPGDVFLELVRQMNRDPAAATEALRSGLQEAHSIEMKGCLASALASLSTRDAVQGILEALSNESEPEVRSELLEALRSVQPGEGLDLLVQAGITADSPEMLAAIGEVVGLNATAATVDLLMGFAAIEDSTMPGAATFLLEQIASDEGLTRMARNTIGFDMTADYPLD